MSTPGTDPAGAWSRRLWPFAALLLVIFGFELVDGILSSIRGGDAPVYVLLAKSIATGAGFSDLNLPGAPAHTQYPPLLPLLLSPLYLLYGFNFTVMRIAVLLFAAAAVYMTGRHFERVGGGGLAAAVAFLVGTNYFFLFFAREIMTEAPYAFFSMAALYFLSRHASEDPRTAEGSRPFVLLLPALFALAYMTRMIGVTLYAGAVAALAASTLASPARDGLRRAAARRLVLFAVMAILPFVVWSLRGALVGGQADTYESIFFQADYYSLDKGGAGLVALASRFAENAADYFRAVPLSMITSSELKDLLPAGALYLLCIVLLVVLAAGLVRELWFTRGPMEFYTLFYFGLLSVWPVYGSGDARRYVVPMLPLLYYYLLTGARVLLSLGEARAGGRMGFGTAASVLAAVLLFMNVFEVRTLLWPPTAAQRVLYGALAAKRDFSGRIEDVTPAAMGADYFAGHVPCFASYLRAAEYLGGVMGPGDVVVTRKPEAVHLVSGRYSVRFPYTGDTLAMDRFMNAVGAGYVLLDACYPESSMYMVPYVLERGNRFGIVYDDGKGTVLLKVLGRRST
ncbi:MAG: glycosyltransferase family 39 protein [Thermodesulfobacteriota bacterium]